ncbi:MAG TPA: hypothetical protein VKX96_13530 [Chloroflexota bacterium]|nr:hypothetical protein [Chloroflexota bacterium]
MHELVEFLVGPRQRDVYVVSLPEDSEDSSQALISVEDLVRRTLGAAHIAVLTGPASYFLTDLVGKEFSVFQAAVRTYRPRLNVDEDEPQKHPLALASRISKWENEGPNAFEQFLINAALRRTVSGQELEKQLPSFTTAHQIAAMRRREAAQEAGASDRELLELALSENQDLKDKLESDTELYESLLAEAEEARDGHATRIEELQGQYHKARARIEYLEDALRKRSASGNLAAEIPRSLDELEAWSTDHLAGSVVLHSRALRAARKSVFQNIELVYQALLILREHYVPMKRYGGLERKRAYDDACRRLGLEESACFGGSRVGEEGDSYVIHFDGRKCLLNRHLKGSNDRDPRFGFRLYFFWDEGSEQVVVGWLPDHLPNRIS